ncbi:APSES transcription factor [Aspergillus luchuensis]|uniref:APSES transcription factor n=1 Tax=Aspergillus kawachii TaxID=1069201 RepID=A0A146FEG2_ASPKA|nr:APSES transcription factor [Aspergillus luchuensis]
MVVDSGSGSGSGKYKVEYSSRKSTDDLVRTDGYESSIARPVEILQLDEFMSQSRRRLEPWICLNDGKVGL